MINPKDEKWLRKALEDCFDKGAHTTANAENIAGFKALIRSFIKNIEKTLNETKTLWETNPNSEELKDRFLLLQKCLFYLRRFCEDR